jgi:hypothetical protein
MAALTCAFSADFLAQSDDLSQAKNAYAVGGKLGFSKCVRRD